MRLSTTLRAVAFEGSGTHLDGDLGEAKYINEHKRCRED
jgi:hypothetical protein